MILWGMFSAKAMDFLANSDARLNILHGSVRSSKTVNCSVRWMEYLVTGPKGDLFMVGKTRASLTRNVLNDIFDLVGDKAYHWVNKQEGELDLCGRRIYCIGANDEKAEGKIRGATIAGALCDEVSLYPESFFNQLMARMSIKGAMCFCNTNPDNPYHWFNVNYIENATIKNKKIWHFDMDDNLNLDEEYKTSLKQMYTGIWYQRLIQGLWVLANGVIYGMFDPLRNVTRDTDDTYDRMLVSIDYGIQNPMTFGLYGVRGTHYHLKDYFYHSGKEVGQQKTDFLYADDLEEFIGDSPVKYVTVDPSATSFISELRSRRFFKDKNIKILPAKNSVMKGIQALSSKIQQGLFTIEPHCIEDKKEFGAYVWDDKAAKRGEDEPLKANDHCMDRNRYAVYTDMVLFSRKINFSGRGAKAR